MKDLIELLREKARWCAAHDDDHLQGVYALPGPHRRGDEAVEGTSRAAEILERERQAIARTSLSDEADGEPLPR